MKPGRFIGHCDVRWIDRDWWMVLRDFVYVASDGERITVKRGFYSDGGSLPWFLRGWISQTIFFPCFVLHDWLYNKLKYSKARADNIINEAIYSLTRGDGGIRRHAIHYGVHLLGWWAWREDQRAQRIKARKCALKCLPKNSG
jgi:hypothetical protein